MLDSSWLETITQTVLPVAVLISTAFTIFILTLPSSYSAFEPHQIGKESFSEDDRRSPEQSGFNYFQKNKNENGKLQIETTVQVVVLGDIGRSPRMQYHTLSLASHGAMVDLIGYVESDVHPDIQASRFIRVIPIRPFPKLLQTENKVLFLLLAPFKVIWQILNLYYALGYRAKATKWMLVQNPPSIPTLAVAQFIRFFRKTRLVIDWHNFGYSILALRLGNDHPLVRLSEWYEGFFAQGASANFAVTNAMTKVLNRKWNIQALPLHDRPPKHFQPLTEKQKIEFVSTSSATAESARNLIYEGWKLLVSSTSWTPDEDFSILLDALLKYSAAVSSNTRLPKLLVIITGKGPQKAHYESRIRRLNEEGKLPNVIIQTAWLSFQDYASLLGSADLGISLHNSTSGVDLPMKVVDMLGTGLPVAGWSDFEAWPELVQEGVNGKGFASADKLAEVLQDLLKDGSNGLETLRKGALKDCDRRWDDEWMDVAGRLFQLK